MDQVICRSDMTEEGYKWFYKYCVYNEKIGTYVLKDNVPEKVKRKYDELIGNDLKKGIINVF